MRGKAEASAQKDNGEKPVVIRMSEDLHERIRARAAAEERSMAQIMRRALRHYVEAVPAGP